MGKNFLSGLLAPVYILVMIFAWSSWVDINGLFVEVPLLVGQLPEGWNLPSYMAIIIQIANVGPIVYTIANQMNPRKIKGWPVVYIIIATGATACMLLAFLWDRTTTIGGELRSTSFLTLTAFLALVDCTSSVVFLPYMALFQAEYMTAYYIGEGLSGFVPGIVGLIQGVGSDPNCVNRSVVIMNETTFQNVTEYQIFTEYDPPLFSVRIFFIVLFGMLCLSGIAFTLLHFLPYCQQAKLKSSHTYDIRSNTEKDSSDKFDKSNKEPEFMESIQDNALTSNTVLVKTNTSRSGKLTNCQYTFLLINTAWINAILNGILPSTQSFTCLPYGNLAYTLALRLSTVSSPLVCFLSLFIRARSLVTVAVLSVLATALTAYQLYIAALSPFPPLKDEAAGVALVIVSSILLAAAIAYAKVTTASFLNDHGGQRSLLWCGAMTQVGSCVGAIVIFCVINVGKVFKSEDFCTGAVY